MKVLTEYSRGVLNRHAPSGKRNHARAKSAMPCVEGQDLLLNRFVNIFGPDFLSQKQIQKICNMYVTARRASDNARGYSSIPRETDNSQNKPQPRLKK